MVDWGLDLEASSRPLRGVKRVASHRVTGAGSGSLGPTGHRRAAVDRDPNRQVLRHRDAEQEWPVRKGAVRADDPDLLARSLAILAEPEVEMWTTRKKLLRAVQLALVTIGRCDAAGVALTGQPGLDGEVCTSAAAFMLDEAQRAAGRGPCLDAVTSLQIFNVESIANASAWPEFRQVATKYGIKSSLSVPLTIRGVAIGMLNLYSKSVNGFEGCERMGATFAAGVAAAVAPPTGTVAPSP